jgi:hypothetical protein
MNAAAVASKVPINALAMVTRQRRFRHLFGSTTAVDILMFLLN